MPARNDFGGLTPFRRVLAVSAHPDDHSFALGGLIARLTKAGATVGVISLTNGRTEAQDSGGLAQRRIDEFHRAAAMLGATLVHAADLTEADLENRPPSELVGLVYDSIAAMDPEVLLTFDNTGVTGQAGHRATTDAVIQAALGEDLPAMGWTISARVARSLNQEFGSDFQGRSEFEIDYVVPAGRKRQMKAIAIHESQRKSFPLVHRRLDLSGPVEWTRWLRPPHASQRR